VDHAKVRLHGSDLTGQDHAIFLPHPDAQRSGFAEDQLLQIGRRPAEAAAEVAGNDASWVTLPSIGPPSSRPFTAPAGDITVLLCSVRGTLYAYRDACAACGSSLAEGTLDREQLICPDCGTRYNVRLAGRGLDDAALHLEPLPLLADSAGVRVAVPESVRS